MSTLPDPRLNLRHKTHTRPDRARRSKTTATRLRPETRLFLAGRAVAVGLSLGWDNPPVAEALRACPALGSRTRGTHSGPRSGALEAGLKPPPWVHPALAGPARPPQPRRPPPTRPSHWLTCLHSCFSASSPSRGTSARGSSSRSLVDSLLTSDFTLLSAPFPSAMPPLAPALHRPAYWDRAHMVWGLWAQAHRPAALAWGRRAQLIESFPSGRASPLTRPPKGSASAPFPQTPAAHRRLSGCRILEPKGWLTMRLKTPYVGLFGGGMLLWRIAARSEVDFCLGFPPTFVFLDHNEPKIRALVVPKGDKSRAKLGVSVTSMN